MSNILIIEDEPSIVMVLQEFLSQEGYNVRKAYNGASGLKALKEYEMTDLVIVDLNMPGLSGKGVIEAMRCDQKLTHIPVIIITGTVLNAVDFPRDGSYQAVLEKPFDLTNMLEKIHNVLGDR